MLLLQAQSRANAVVAQVVVQSALLRRELVQINAKGLVLTAPKDGVRIERGPVH